jgi:hypothetical protein
MTANLTTDTTLNNRIAYTRRPEGRRRQKLGPWLEIGRGRVDADGVVRVFLDRMPVGGFSGFVCLALPDMPPPADPQPTRPDTVRDDNAEDEEDA